MALLPVCRIRDESGGEDSLLLLIPAEAWIHLSLVIPAEAGIHLDLALLFAVVLRARASTPPMEERVTLFFTRVKIKSHQKRKHVVCAPGETHCKSEKSRSGPDHGPGLGTGMAVK
jgi:hypothetical protein